MPAFSALLDNVIVRVAELSLSVKVRAYVDLLDGRILIVRKDYYYMMIAPDMLGVSCLT